MKKANEDGKKIKKENIFMVVALKAIFINQKITEYEK